jgi:TolB-like protein/class 3 adenylate cyclase/Tfp pilus assembly protein PilF
MQESITPNDQQFLKKAIGIIEDHISNEQFGVSELAEALNMSRSNLLRKIKKLTNQSVSQFIREVRLKGGMELLSQGSLNVSEVAFKVGFSSTSYFIKCFKEYYGYPPGEAGKQEQSTDADETGGFERVHQLSAIMFTDIEGYTALMQRDEARAVSFRDRHREVFNAAIKKYNGRILQYYGDGTLSTFSSAIHAVRCAIEMQLAFRTDPAIPVRIGIHTGDIIFTEDDIIGDGVNVASRVESLAVSGSVFISEKVFDEVKNQPDIQTSSMGVFELKNVEKPLEVYAITNPGLEVPKSAKIDGKGKILKKPAGGNDLRGKKTTLLWTLLPIVVIAIAYSLYTSGFFGGTSERETAIQTFAQDKSIAVLPFINDSPDSSNVYIINGLMESILNNLQKIEEIRVISRTSVEKYRNNPMTIPEIARELNVRYFVEGSGQKVGNRILLNIQLIEAQGDKHLWSEQYAREVQDIFQLQQEVAKNIAGQIEVIITPEEQERIEKIPTENLVAYDYFLQGQELIYRGGTNSGGWEVYKRAVEYFKKAIREDANFAHAYAEVAIAYYYLEIFQTQKEFTDSIEKYAEKAMLLDPQLPQGLLAKAYSHLTLGESRQALPYLEKALEYNPNSVLIIRELASYYVNFVPNTEKYIQYALKGIRLEIGGNDSTEASYLYLHISNALIQTGFIEEALMYINKSLDYNPDNLFSVYVRAYILLAQDMDLKKAKRSLIEAFQRDTTRMDILQEIGKVCYFMRDYQESYKYYKPFVDAREKFGLTMFTHENIKIAFVYRKLGKTEEAESLIQSYKYNADHNPSIYKTIMQSGYYAYRGEDEQALEYLERFVEEEEDYHYWTILFFKMDPIFDKLLNHPRFQKAYEKLDAKFWKNHEAIRTSLEEEGLI